MPTPPEFRHRQGLIRMCKVSGNLETKDPSKALGHEGIAVKIKIKLQTESDDSHPRQRRPAMKSQV